MNAKRLLFAAVITAAAAPAARAMPEEAFQNWLDRYDQRWERLFERSDDVTPKQVRELRSQAIGRLDIGALTPAQLAKVHDRSLLRFGRGDKAVDHTDEALDRLAAFTDRDDPQGATALALKAMLSARRGETPPEQRAELFKAALNHPAIGQAIRRGMIPGLFTTLDWRIGDKALAKLGDELLALAPAITENPSSELVNDYMHYYKALETAAGEKREKDVKRVHARLMGAAERFEKQQASELKKKDRQRLAEVIERLRYAPQVADLVGGPAPEINFTWFSGDRRVRKLSDLRGNVVVLDFWATWCGPCVASFPNVRRLQRHYEGYPVTIVGVTSPQGSVVMPGRGKIKAENAEKEYELMRDYIERKNITWPIAFSERDVFNPAYGVRGIPHMTIVDPEGVVRHNDLHPGTSVRGKAKKINAILREFDKPAPPLPEEDADQDKDDSD